MKAGALVLVFSFLAAPWVQAADMPAPKPRKSTPSVSARLPVTHFQGCEDLEDAQKFASRVCYTNYDPNVIPPGASATRERPKCDGQPPNLGEIRDAYAIAPDFVKKKLCGLTRHDGNGNTRLVGCKDCFQLFVMKSNQNKPWRSWGYWEAEDRGAGDGVFVAISEELLSGRKIADEENDVLAALLANNPWPGSLALPVFESTDSRTALGVLAVLSHELGHAVFADKNADLNRRNERDEFGKIGSSPGRQNQNYRCFHRDFIKTSWSPRDWNKRRWVKFGEQAGNKQKDINFDVSATKGDISNARPDGATKSIKDVYGVRQFASVLAAVSPEEDFAEAYKYRMLSDLRSRPDLNLTFPAAADTVFDVVAYMNDPNQKTVPDKLACAYALSEQP